MYSQERREGYIRAQVVSREVMRIKQKQDRHALYGVQQHRVVVVKPVIVFDYFVF